MKTLLFIKYLFAVDEQVGWSGPADVDGALDTVLGYQYEQAVLPHRQNVPFLVKNTLIEEDLHIAETPTYYTGRSTIMKFQNFLSRGGTSLQRIYLLTEEMAQITELPDKTYFNK